MFSKVPLFQKMSNIAVVFLGVFIFLMIIGSAFTHDSNETAQLFNDTAKLKTNSTKKCLKTLTEAEVELSSLTPIIEEELTNNYQNITRALFPPMQQPSLYIKITLQLVNETGARKTLSAKKFTWSASRHFVSVEFVSLTAMSWLSLGTILPTRRESELVLTVRPLCKGAGKKNNFKNNDGMWKFILLQLQDIAIMPNISDPRLNTAQIVVSGHEGDEDQPIDYPKDGIDRAKWWMILVSSILAAGYVGVFTINYKESCIKAVKLTIIISCAICAVCFSGISIVFFAIEVSTRKGERCLYSSVHFSLLSSSFILFLVYLAVGKCKRTIKSAFGDYGITASWYFIVQHSLWVLCGGISTEPTWAIPLFLAECFLVFIIVGAIYLCFLKKFRPTNQPNNDETDESVDLTSCFIHLICGVLALIATMATAMLSFVHHVGLPTENILEVIIAGVLFWLVKKSGIFKQNEPANNAPPPANHAPPQANNASPPANNASVAANNTLPSASNAIEMSDVGERQLLM